MKVKVDSIKANPYRHIETVSAAKEFIDSELMRKDPDESIRILFESDHAMNQASTHGAGRDACADENISTTIASDARGYLPNLSNIA